MGQCLAKHAQVKALLEIREVAKSDSLFILPDEIVLVLNDIDNQKPINITRKT